MAKGVRGGVAVTVALEVTAMLLRMMLLMCQSSGLLQQQLLPHGRILGGRGSAARWQRHTATWRRRRWWHATVIERQLLGAANIANARRLPMQLVVFPELGVVRGGAGATQQIGQQGAGTRRRRRRCWGTAAGPGTRTGTSANHDGTHIVGQRSAFLVKRLIGIRVGLRSQQLLLLLVRLLLLPLHIRLHRILLQRLERRIGHAMRLARLQVGELGSIHQLTALKVIDAFRHRMPGGLNGCSRRGYHR